MHALVLTTRAADNRYGDTPSTYSFPRMYLRFFEPLNGGNEIVAVLFEPRHGGGRQSYFGWVTMRDAPRPDPREEGLWQVSYADGIQMFPRLVPRVGDQAFEASLRELPLRQHGLFMQNRSVRPIGSDDLIRIFEHAGVIPPDWSAPEEDATSLRRRHERMVHSVVRDAGFQKRVLATYDYRCAVSGLGYVNPSKFARGGLVEAAHIRPVGGEHAGHDDVTNGIALTPSLHGLFDAGMFTLRYEGGVLLVRTSPLLHDVRLNAPEMGTCLRLENDMPVRLPESTASWPARSSLEYHARRIFRP
ncbi:HNH endonuclease [Deinococcus aluminii]|uniref:HNH nuclease domain-containing protein n=1 Tax=Deinococcus aluminii TaxID=1656885 RepID=A0ABP9XGP9_9DEIO